MPRLNLILCLGLAASLAAAEKSVSLAYGPRNQLVITVNRGALGAYSQPILEYADDSRGTFRESGARFGFLYSLAALAWKDFECRAQVGAGSHLAWRTDTWEPSFPAETRYESESSQQGLELWIQPEFRFRKRFALLLEAHFLRDLKETDDAGAESHRVGFVTPDYTLGEVGFGIRYYLPFGGE